MFQTCNTYAPGIARLRIYRWERRRLNETVDIPARIAELRSVLLETRSEDLREAIQAAIEDCQQKLAELDDPLAGGRRGPAPPSPASSGETRP